MKTWIPDNRFFPYFTWQDVDALPRETTLLILPTAAIEQHGHHLPLATDTLLNNYLLGHALQLLPAEAPIYALAPLCYGKSNEHLGFPGTLSLSATTMMAVIRDIAQSLHTAGFKRLVLYNTHGGNSSLIDMMSRDLRAEFDMQVFCLYGAGVPLPGVSPQEASFGFHANEVETALLLDATPELVHPDRYTTCYIRQLGDERQLVPEKGAATYAWLTRDISPTGVLGDPTPSTAENGKAWRTLMAEGIASLLKEMLAHRLDPKPRA